MYATKDISLASALISNRMELKGIEKINDKIAEFLFAESTQLEDMVEAFWQRKLYVDAMTFQENIRSLKSRIAQ